MSHQINMIAYCGVFCKECPANIKQIAFYAHDLKGEIDNYESKRLLHQLKSLDEELNTIGNFKVFYEILEYLEELKCDSPCRECSGNPRCEVGICCKNKALSGCWECIEFNHCGKLNDLKDALGKAYLDDIRLLREEGMDRFLEIKENTT